MIYPRLIMLSAALSVALISGAAAQAVKPAAKRLLTRPTLVGPAAVPLAASSAAAPAAGEYTGILLDARQLPTILRSPAPAIYGPSPDMPLLYPNRSDVPTPDEVQDESIVRYYHTEAEANAGVGGSHPLILTALAVLGPAHDALQLSADDMSRLQDAEKTLHFVETWKVGFLIPAGQ